MVAFHAQAQNRFSVNGVVRGLPDGSAVSLSNANAPDDTLAIAVVSKGAFRLTGSVDEANLYQLNFLGPQKKTVLFMGNDSMSVTGDISAVQDISVTGSASQRDFDEFKKTFNPLFEKLSAMSQQLNAQPESRRPDSLMTAYKAHVEHIRSAVDAFVNAHRNSPVAPFVVLVTGEMEQDGPTLERRFNNLDQSAQQGFYGKILRQQIDDSKVGAVGSPAIDFTQATPEGQMVSLSSFRGKYVLVDFWASWCGPCRMENPNVVKAFNKFKNKNFTIVGVSLDKDRAAWTRAIKDDKLVWTQVSDLKFWNNEAAARYKIQAIPQNVLVSPEGVIVARNLRGRELEERLCQLFGCK